jgi:hypothetical protein
MARNKQLSEGEFWADKLMDLANLSAVVLIFGQLVTPTIRWDTLGLGAVLYIVIVILAKIAITRR